MKWPLQDRNSCPRRLSNSSWRITPRRAKPAWCSNGLRPKLAAWTHLVFLANERVSPASTADLITETRQSYSGPLVVGEDSMSFEIGETVHIRRCERPGTGTVVAGSS